jgi:hypothetical protein
VHDHDRERLSASIALAVLLHAVVGVVFWLAGWTRVEPYPEYTPPLYVDLESSFVPEDPQEVVEEPPEELNLQEPAPEQPAPAEPAPSEPAPTEEAPATETPPAADVAPPQAAEPAPPPPASQPAETPDAPAPPADSPTAPADPQPAQPEAEPQETFDYEGNMATLYGREERDDAPRRPADDGLFDIPEEPSEEPEDLPDWVNQLDNAGIPTEEMETEEIEELATKIERDPELEALMRRANQAIEQGRVPQAETSGSDSPRTSESASPATETIGENAAIQWSGPEGGRGPGGELPNITASDFQGPIPPRITFVVAFDVDSQGVVIPGSVIVQRKSGSTQVDRKVRNAILGWKFLPKPGADRETGVFTLVVERQDIR